MATQILFFGLLALTCSVAMAFDPIPLQDLCVADLNSSVLVNGIICKDPKLVTADDFFTSGLHLPGKFSVPVGLKASPVFVPQMPGLNTLGITMGRVDYAPSGANPPHTHPRATEILTVLEGIIEAGFVTSNPGNVLYSKVLQKGDVFVFPMGLVHYQRNVGHTTAVAIVAFNSQNPGVITVADSVFGSNPDISTDLLSKSFKVDKTLATYIQSHF